MIGSMQTSDTTVLDRVQNMVHEDKAKKIAEEYGLSIQNVSWEDNARDKGSSWGPCISDMTLQVNEKPMPVIRFSNYEDITCDIKLDKIQLVVGNERSEKDAVFCTVTLKEYLENFKDYLHDPSSWKGGRRSLLREKDTHAIVSAQACFLPVEKGSDAKFNVGIYNYQSEEGDPTVLAIVATSKGTSAQVVENANGHSGQKLYFNKSGQRCSFIGQRVSDFRKEKDPNATDLSAPMTESEKRDNVLMIIQVPLKKKIEYRSRGGSMPKSASAMCMLQSFECRSRGVDVEDAIVKVGESEGPFTEVNHLEIERDERFPVRVTLQFYKTTSNGEVNDAIMGGIFTQVKSPQANADHVGSLVVNPDLGRPTEFKRTPETDKLTPNQVAILPKWWRTFWMTHSASFSTIKEDQAIELIFARNRQRKFELMGYSQADEDVKKILSQYDNNKSLENGTKRVCWDPLGSV